MSKKFPPAVGHTNQVYRRSYDPVTPLSDFCYSLRYQRTLDIDQIGFNPDTGKVMWVLENFATPKKNCTVSAQIAESLDVPFIALKSSKTDHQHSEDVSFIVRHKSKEVRFENSTWEQLKKVLEKIALNHIKNQPVPRERFSYRVSL